MVVETRRWVTMVVVGALTQAEHSKGKVRRIYLQLLAHRKASQHTSFEPTNCLPPRAGLCVHVCVAMSVEMPGPKRTPFLAKFGFKSK